MNEIKTRLEHLIDLRNRVAARSTESMADARWWLEKQRKATDKESQSIYSARRQEKLAGVDLDEEFIDVIDKMIAQEKKEKKNVGNNSR